MKINSFIHRDGTLTLKERKKERKILLFPSTYTKLNFCSSDIPVIPDLEDVQEEDMMTQIAAPPRWDVTLPTGDGGGGK